MNTSKTVKLSAILKSKYYKEAVKIFKYIISDSENKNYAEISARLNSLVPESNSYKRYIFNNRGYKDIFVAAVLFLIAGLIFCYLLFIGIGTLVFSDDYFKEGLLISGISGIAVIIDFLIFPILISELKFKKRFDIYFTIIRFKNIVFIKELSDYFGEQEFVVIKDLKRAIKKKYIPRGEFSSNNDILIASDIFGNEYINNRDTYDGLIDKIIEKREKKKNIGIGIKRITDLAEQYIINLNLNKVKINDNELLKIIDSLQKTVTLVFFELEKDHKLLKDVTAFLRYLLPVSEKIINDYVSATDEKQLIRNLGQKQEKRREAKKLLYDISAFFEGILSELYVQWENDLFMTDI